MELLGITFSKMGTWIFWILAGQMAVLVSICICVLGLIIARRTFGKRQAQRISKYQEALVEFVISHMDGRKTPLPAVAKSDRVLFRDLLLNMILSLQGAEKNELVHQYSLLGYLSEDRAQLRSPLWWRRLAAIVRISHLESTATQSDLVSSLTDTHRLVSQVAMESLSRFQTPFAAKCVLKQIAHQPPERDDLLTELFVGAARSTDMDEIFSVAAKSPEPRVKMAAVRAAGKLHSLEAVPRLIEMARSYVNDEELLVSVLISLKEIGDPRATESTLRLLKNPSGRVRARAIEALSIYGDISELADFDNFQNDPSLEVRRVVHALKSRRAA